MYTLRSWPRIQHNHNISSAHHGHQGKHPRRRGEIRDGDALEDVDEYFDKSIVKDQFELAMRMAEVARSVSERHRRMTSKNLSQTGQLVNLSNMPIGSEAYI